MYLPNSKQKLIRALRKKKERISQKLFLVEGHTNVTELLLSDKRKYIVFLVGTPDYWSTYLKPSDFPCYNIYPSKLSTIGSLSTNHTILALVRIFLFPKPNWKTGSFLMLEKISNPGNLGAILRVADWFNLDGVVVEQNGVSWHNSKVIRGSMGSFLRIGYWEMSLINLLKSSPLPIIGTSLSGKNINSMKLPKHGFMLIGQETRGLSQKLLDICQQQVKLIPINKEVNSLNVATAVAILVYIWKN